MNEVLNSFNSFLYATCFKSDAAKKYFDLCDTLMKNFPAIKCYSYGEG